MHKKTIQNVMILTHEFSYGGIEEYIRSICEVFNKKKQKIFLHAWEHHLEGGGGKSHFTKIKKIRYKYDQFFIRPFINLFRQTLSLTPFLFETKPSLIITNSVKSYFFSIPSLFLYTLFHPEIKIVHQFHGSLYLESKSLYKGSDSHLSLNTKIKLFIYFLCEFLCYFLLRNIIVFSDYAKTNILVKTFKVNSKKIHFCKPGKTYQPKIISKKTAKHLLGLSQNIPLVLTLSRIEPRKGISEFLKISHVLKKQKKKINIILGSAYEEPYSQSGKILFEDHSAKNLGTAIFYLNNPSKKEIQLLYNAADAFLMPSTDLETFGFATLEAISFGLPVFCFTIGANPEIIQHHFNGFMRNKKRPLLLAQDIIHYLNKDTAYKKTIKKNCLKVANNYTWENYWQLLYSFVEKN